MNIENVTNEYKKLAYFKQLELYINDCIRSDYFDGELFSDYQIVIKTFKEWLTDSDGKILEKHGRKIPNYDYDFIDNIDAIKGYFIQCLEVVKKSFNCNNYDGFSYQDVFETYINELLNNVERAVYLKYLNY